MDNVSWGTFGTSKKEESKLRYVMPAMELLENKNKLLSDCSDLICSIEELYGKAPCKELYDVIVTLNSAKRSLKAVHVKETELDD